MSDSIPSSVLFCCDHNAVRSPMAEGMMKQMYGQAVYVQSAGGKSDLEIDGFAIAVCQEIGVELSRHQARSFDEMQEWGDDLSGYDLVICLSPASQRRALDLTRFYHLEVEYWPVLDPTGLGEGREAKLMSYRQTRDQIKTKLLARFGPPVEEGEDAWSAADAWERYHDGACPPSGLTISSDGGGCLPVFDDHGAMVKMDFATSAGLTDTLRELLARGQNLEHILPSMTANVARLLKLRGKGRIEVGADADFVCLDEEHSVRHVMARGQWMVQDHSPVVQGLFDG